MNKINVEIYDVMTSRDDVMKILTNAATVLLYMM